MHSGNEKWLPFNRLQSGNYHLLTECIMKMKKLSPINKVCSENDKYTTKHNASWKW